MGTPYIWPAEHLGKLKALLDTAMDTLGKMINPPTGDWTYLDMGGDREELVDAIRSQITALQARRQALLESRTSAG